LIERAIYDKYLRLYHWSVALADKLDQVIEDGEHRLCLEEGMHEGGWILPDPDFMREDVDALKAFLKTIDPFRCTSVGKDRVKVSAQLAVQMHYMSEIDHLIVKKLFHMFRSTDYLKYQRHLRDRGIKYAGPTSLGEILNTYFELAHTRKMTDDYMARHKISKNWHQHILA
jgi:hypothetical protein